MPAWARHWTKRSQHCLSSHYPGARSKAVPGLLVDTDVLAQHLRGVRACEPHDTEVYVSALALTELLAGQPPDDAPVLRLLGALRELPVDAAVAARAGRLRSQSGGNRAGARGAARA